MKTPAEHIVTHSGDSGPSQLSLPVGIQLLAGMALIYYALHGWDRKYQLIGGSLAGEGAPSATNSDRQPGLPE